MRYGDQCGKGDFGDCQVTECDYVALGLIRKASSVLTFESSPTETKRPYTQPFSKTNTWLGHQPIFSLNLCIGQNTFHLVPSHTDDCKLTDTARWCGATLVVLQLPV